MWASCPDKGLAGAAEAAPTRVLGGKTCFIHPIFVALVLVVALFVLHLRLLSGFPFLPCYVWPWRVALTARAQVKGSKAEPLLLYTDRSPRAWPYISAARCWARPKMVRGQLGRIFMAVTVPSTALPHDPR